MNQDKITMYEWIDIIYVQISLSTVRLLSHYQ